MTTLHIANNRTQEMVGDLTALTRKERQTAGCGAQRALWFARDDDVLVVPWLPDKAFLEYVTELTGTRHTSLRLVVPPPGHVGPDVLSADRLADESFRTALREALKGRPIEAVFAQYNDAVVVALVRALGAEDVIPGHGFIGQAGTVFVNSKAMFRATAAGVGIPVSDGMVATHPQDAETAIVGLLTENRCAILKQDFHLGGSGNEIVSPAGGVPPVGAAHVVVLRDRAGVQDYLAHRWDWLTNGGRYRVVIEHYHPRSVPIYAEFKVTDLGIEFIGQGEVLMAPLIAGMIVPAPTVPPDTMAKFLDDGRRLCEPLRGLGYRGNVSVDGFLTPAGEVLFSEFNGRVGGSTHLHHIGEHVIGGDYLRDRVIVERPSWAVPAFRDAVARLAHAGLAYDPATRTGVVLTCDFVHVHGTVEYCLVAKDIEEAREREKALTELFADAPA